MRALILTTHTGGGHDAAARAVSEALEARQVETRVMDCVAFGGKILSKTVSGTYVRMVKTSPATFGKIYHLGEHFSRPSHKSVVYAANASYALRMVKLLSDYRPDIVVCTHQFGGQSMTWLRRHGWYSGLLCMVMTDYTYSPFMEDVEADILTVSHPSVVAECLAKGMPEETLWPGGIPVSPSCRPVTDKAAAKAKLGLDPNRREVLLIGGSMGAGHLPDLVAELLPCLGDAHLTVICGSNASAKEKLTSHLGEDGRVTVLGAVNPIYNRLAASDVLVTKTGGLTSTEAMTVGVAMVAANPIEGCETANAALFEKLGLAVWPRSKTEIAPAVKKLLEDEAAREAMVKRQHEEIDPDCASKLAALLVERAASVVETST